MDSQDTLEDPFKVYVSSETVPLKLRMDFLKSEISARLGAEASTKEIQDYLCD